MYRNIKGVVKKKKKFGVTNLSRIKSVKNLNFQRSDLVKRETALPPLFLHFM